MDIASQNSRWKTRIFRQILHGLKGFRHDVLQRILQISICISMELRGSEKLSYSSISSKSLHAMVTHARCLRFMCKILCFTSVKSDAAEICPFQVRKGPSFMVSAILSLTWDKGKVDTVTVSAILHFRRTS